MANEDDLLLDQAQEDAWDELLENLSEEEQDLIKDKIAQAEQNNFENHQDTALEAFKARHFSIECDPEAKNYINRLIQNRIESPEYPEESEYDCLILMLKALNS